MPSVNLPFQGIRAINADARADKPTVIVPGRPVSLYLDDRGIHNTVRRRTRPGTRS